MAKLLENTRIYRDVTQMMEQTLDFTKDFPKAYRYSVGQQMQELTIRMVNEIASAYITRNMEKKIARLDDFQADFNTFKTFFRIASERRWMQGLGRRASIFANFLLWFLEAVFKESGIAFHGRYVDDIYAIDKNKEKLLTLVPKIRTRLLELGLRLNEKKFYLQHYAKGIQFTGTIVKPGRIYPLRRNVRKFKESVRKLNLCRTADEVLNILPTVNSYLGLLIHYNTYTIRKRELSKLDKPVFEFIYIKGHYESVAIKRKYTKRYEIIQRIKEEDRKYKKSDIMEITKEHLWELTAKPAEISRTGKAGY